MPEEPNIEMTTSGRPLRAKYDGLFYLFGSKFRVVDLEAKRDLFLTEDQLKAKLTPKSWGILRRELMMNGFFEQGIYRVEVWK